MSVNEVYPIIWIDDHVRLIDQNRLPETYTLVDIRYVHDMAEAIRTMIVRGAPPSGWPQLMGCIWEQGIFKPLILQHFYNNWKRSPNF
jgi:methylthioribose-1-phosphate isomerase